MTPLRCACLVAQRDDRLLLVRVRENEHWYLPGGKVEDDEAPEDALQRELWEELGISLDPASVRYLYTVVGPAYGQPGEVALICFAADWDQEPRPKGEISDVQWLHWQDHARFAPAVRILCARHLREEQPYGSYL